MDKDLGFADGLALACGMLDDAIAHRTPYAPALALLQSRMITPEHGATAVEYLFRRGYVTVATQLGELVNVDAIAIGVRVSTD